MTSTREAGRVLSAIGYRGAPGGLANDALLAASCRESGMTLVSANPRDFRRIADVLAGFDWTAPWPSG